MADEGDHRKGPTAGPTFLGIPGEVARRAAELDWAASPLGPPEGWSAELREMVRVLLTSRFSMWMAWGPQLTMFYNDAYRRDTLRAKHPWALGRPAPEVWAEIWDDIAARVESVLRTGASTWDEDLLLFLERSGYPEETYHTFSYSPLTEDGQVVGMLCVVTENTDRVVSERRMATLRDLAAGLSGARSEAALVDAVERELATNPRDVPFALVYLSEEPDRPIRLAAAVGVDRSDPAAAPDAGAWPVERVHAGEAVRLAVPAHRFGTVPVGAWTVPPTEAVAVPLAVAQGEDAVRGMLVVGLNPMRRYDDRYRVFVELLAGQVSAALVNVGAYEAERRRAEALAALDRAKTEFFSNVSHEFRTPLTLISGPVTELLAAVESGSVPDRGRLRTELAAADRNVQRLGRLVDNLLDFSRVQAGRAQARSEPTALAAVTADLASMFRSAAERAGLALTVDVPAQEEPVPVDPSMWEKVVLNLLSNALKYTVTGGITVRVRTDGAWAVLEVEDTGVGIPSAELPRLFERFHRVSDVRGRSVEGSGIGLALVRELVELHGGQVDVRSTAGVGTTFTVRIPRRRADLPGGADDDGADDDGADDDGADDDGADDDGADGDAPAGGARRAGADPAAAAPYIAEALGWTSPADGPAAAPVDRPAPEAAPSVLVVDDSADMREYLARLLGEHYRVETAPDGAAAVEAATARPPDAVITDVMMPRLDGFGLLAALRAHPRTAALPVIMLSARAGQEAAVDGLSAGADEYLVKPFTAAELLARVRSVLTMARVRRREAAWRGALLHALRDGLFVVDGDGRVVEVNDGFGRILGYGPEGVPYDPPHPWWPDPETDPEAYAGVRAAVADVRAAGRGRHLLQLRHRDGHRLWVETSIDTVTDPAAPTPSMLIGVARDVTDARRAAGRDRLLAEAGRLLAGPDGRDERLAARLQRVAELAATWFAGLVVVACTGVDGRVAPAAVARPHRIGPAARAREQEPYRLRPELAEACRRGHAFVLDPVPPELLPGALDGDEPGAPPSAALVAPLVTGGRMMGLLVVARPREHSGRSAPAAAVRGAAGPDWSWPGRTDRGDVEVAEELARRIATALEADRVATREQQLNAATAALAAAAGVDEAATALAGAVRTALDASGVVVYVVRATNGHRMELVHREGIAPQAVDPLPDVGADDPLGAAEAARTRTSAWIGDPDRCRARFPGGPDAHGAGGVRALAALPLLLGARLVGVVCVTFGTPREFPAAERTFATTLTGQAAQAFDRAALADARWDVAQILQNALLPAAPPAVDRLAVASRYLPAVHDVAAGGDWYQVIPLDEHRTAVVVGDVVGQGATAAAVMGQLRSALAATLIDLGPAADPAEALRRLNRYAFTVPGARGSTAVCLVVDVEAARVRWASAGHLPPLVVRHDGETGFLLDAAGPLLGAFGPEPGAPPLYSSAATACAAGDTVVLYTDGIVERRGEVIDAGMDRLAEVAGRSAGRDPAALVASLFAEEVPEGGGHDDIAVVAARVLPAVLRGSRPADPQELAAFRREIEDWAAAAALDPDVTDDLQLATGEAAANAIEHAYPTGGGRFDYVVQLADGGRRVDVTVADRGRWRPPPADRGYRGRGLELIRSIGSDVVVTPGGGGGPAGGTAVRFTLVQLAEPGTPGPAGAAAASPRPPEPVRAGSLRVDRDGTSVRRLVLVGEIDLATIDTVRALLRAALELDRSEGTAVELDLTEVGYLASAGIGLVLEVVDHARAAGRPLRVVPPPAGPAHRALTLAGLDRLLDPPGPRAVHAAPGGDLAADAG